MSCCSTPSQRFPSIQPVGRYPMIRQRDRKSPRPALKPRSKQPAARDRCALRDAAIISRSSGFGFCLRATELGEPDYADSTNSDAPIATPCRSTKMPICDQQSWSALARQGQNQRRCSAARLPPSIASKTGQRGDALAPIGNRSLSLSVDQIVGEM